MPAREGSEGVSTIARTGCGPGAELLSAGVGDGAPEDALDPVRTAGIFGLLEQTVYRYFRVRVFGAEHLPAGRGLIVGCHSGVLPWDATCLVVAVHRATGRFSRNVGDRFFASLGPIERFLRSTGLVIGKRDAVEGLLARDHLVVVFPGGADDMRRPIWRRYQVAANRGLRPGRGGYVKAAIRTGSPVVPVAIVGTEEIHLMLGDLPLLARVLGVPFFPVVLSPLPLPARVYIRFGPAVRFPVPPEAADDQETVDRLNGEMRERLQALIDDTLRRRRGIYWSDWDGETP